MVNLGDPAGRQLDPPDLEARATWYREAADAGNTGAMVNLGEPAPTQLEPPDLDGAQTWYQKAADAGNTDAMDNLGSLLAAARAAGPGGRAEPGTRRPPTRGHRRHGRPREPAAERLEPPDLEAAQAWYRKAADAGDTDAMVNLGNVLTQLEPPDLEGAQTWFRRAADLGNIDAMLRLGILLTGRSRRTWRGRRPGSGGPPTSGTPTPCSAWESC